MSENVIFYDALCPTCRDLARQLSDAVARAEAAEAERDAANALGAETTVQLKSAQYHLGVMVKAWEAAEARIAAGKDALVDFRLQMTPAAAYGFEAALAEPVEPQPSACATCGGTGTVWIAERDRIRPCPSCTPPDPESETP